MSFFTISPTINSEVKTISTTLTAPSFEHITKPPQLTTYFTPSASCNNSTLKLIYHNGPNPRFYKDFVYLQSTGYAGAECLPPDFRTERWFSTGTIPFSSVFWFHYSPGVCPVGYRTWSATSTMGEWNAVCCPRYAKRVWYTAQADN